MYTVVDTELRVNKDLQQSLFSIYRSDLMVELAIFSQFENKQLALKFWAYSMPNMQIFNEFRWTIWHSQGMSRAYSEQYTMDFNEKLCVHLFYRIVIQCSPFSLCHGSHYRCRSFDQYDVALEYLLFVITLITSQSSDPHNGCWFNWANQACWYSGHYDESQSWVSHCWGLFSLVESFSQSP